MLGIISTYERGADLVVEWKIYAFFTLWDIDGACYFSDDFYFGGERWLFGIFPGGSNGHVDLVLQKYNSNRSIKQLFSFFLKTAEGEKYNEVYFSNDFDNNNYIYRFNRVIPRSELTRRRSELVPEGVLTVICTMKSLTSAGNATMKYPQDPCVEASTQTLDVSIQTVEASIQTVEASIQTVEISTQTVKEKCEASASGSSTNLHENKLHDDLKELFLKKEDCDVTIKVKDSEFPAHRAILKARSPVFASTFRHDLKENATGILEIEDCDPSIFSDFLCFLYCADDSIISQENVFGLYTAADKYQILDLRAKYLELIKKNLTVDTFCETHTLALRHSETELIKLNTDYFKKNVPKIIVTVKWQTFLAENPTESNELLVKCFVPNSC